MGIQWSTGFPHGLMAAEQEPLHQESTVEYELLPSHVSSSMGEDIQYLNGVTFLQFAIIEY